MNKAAAIGLCLIAALLTPAARAADCAGATLAYSEADQTRMAQLGSSRVRGLAEALESDNPSERATIAALFKTDHAVPLAADLPGLYQCRTIKLGGLSPTVVYDWFKCEIKPGEGGRMIIRKTTGSQNFGGDLELTDSGWAYRGVLFYGYESGPGAYAADEERQQAGCLTSVTGSPFYLTLELPAPKFESTHDVIELRPLD